DAQYYSAICALELGHRNGEALLTNFINNNPESTNIKEACFEMGRYNYLKKRYKNVIKWLNKIRPYNLEKGQRDEYYFKLGYSYFIEKNYQKASQSFLAVKNKQSKYSSSANYYYGHIAFTDGKYKPALESFLKIQDDPAFKEVVPFYISQIYFKNKEYDKVIDYGKPLLESPNTESKSDIAGMIGDAYYFTDRFKDASKYYEIAKADSKKKFDLEAIYRMAYSFYKIEDYENGLKQFEKVSSLKTALGQNAAFHLADCYLKQGNKIKARSAFSTSMKLDFDQDIKEESLFSFAKLTYDLAYSPFNETIRAFDNFIKLFPNSKHINDAYDYLVKVYIHAKNYKDALSSLDKIEDKSTELKAAYQRIAYFRALELFNNLQYDQALIYLDKSLVYYWYDKSIKAQSYYWKAEAYFRMGDNNEAIKYYKEFMKSPGVYGLPEYKLCQYNLGYSYFKNENYQEAVNWFNKYIMNNRGGNPKILSDAYNRLGDCRFLARSYWQAIEFYDKAISLKQSDADYSLFQRGFALGLLNRNERKSEVLTELIDKFPKSTYCDDALFELSKNAMTMEQSIASENYCKEIIRKYPNSNYVKKAYQQLGLIYYNSNKNEDALNMYKKVITDFSGTEEARSSLQGIKNIMVEMNKVDEYFAYVRSIGGQEDISINEQDSLTYRAAENIYMTSDFERAKEQFSKYIGNFPTGRYILNAHYYKADCNYRDNETDAALTSYDYIVKRPNNKFTENALRITSPNSIPAL
ncbi:tetratricopeptide repeat protein, partial [Bacteroidota bacterium]